ncbi:MAG: Sbal_3080 family lipoprotein [Burkholderiaceae bacterium]|jgi:hypothetical protein|nr:Sbal_3080 family lipoprotein [Burkholderiaceae bacterium]
MNKLFFIAPSIALLAGCTAIQVSPVSSSVKMHNVCIQENPKVQVADLIQVLEAGFARHGIGTQVFKGQEPANCEFTLNYVAFRAWDMVPYMRDANFIIKQNDKVIATADYHLKAGGGLALTKYASTKDKLDPVIDQLLASVSNPSDNGPLRGTQSAAAPATPAAPVAPAYAPAMPTSVPSVTPAAPAPKAAVFTNMVLSAQKLSTQMGCGDVRSTGGTTFQARCSADYAAIIDCAGGTCRLARGAKN